MQTSGQTQQQTGLPAVQGTVRILIICSTGVQGFILQHSSCISEGSTSWANVPTTSWHCRNRPVGASLAHTHSPPAEHECDAQQQGIVDYCRNPRLHHDYSNASCLVVYLTVSSRSFYTTTTAVLSISFLPRGSKFLVPSPVRAIDPLLMTVSRPRFRVPCGVSSCILSVVTPSLTPM